ncbi:uncharacterized protein LOC126846276 [Adelges cooleyi]|uniref:uncharacterized protein LOC126846276 n=1 Tax=Adelges cooleyi TaxID=133065 RepID=UPI00217F7EE8|nr:uncharacterized protein LOC126846276 [Adelges cooleyi]
MHLKSAIILFVVYFFTSVWSVGLNEDQINNCIELYKNRKDIHYIQSIPYLLGTVFRIQNAENVFTYNPEEVDYIHFSKLFLVFAYKGTKDWFEYNMLTSFEVHFYLKMFIRDVQSLNQHGYLTRHQLSVVFEHLYLNVDEKAINLVNKIIDGDKINPPEFLLIMLEVQPEGNGLNQAQIEEFITLYTLPKTETGSINPLKIHNIFKEFRMAIESYVDLMIFESNRPAAKELMELMLVTAVRSRTVNENEDEVLSTNEVKSLIYDFKQLDTDKDGLLCNNEAEVVLGAFRAKNISVGTFNFNGNEINVAEYLLLNLFEKLASKASDMDVLMSKLKI